MTTEPGWVYCMTTQSMPGLAKIGCTAKIEERLAQANSNSTWLPFPFVLEFAKYVTAANTKEKLLHKLLKDERVNPNREFFKADLDHVKLLFSLCDGTWWEARTEDPDEVKKRELATGEENVSMFLNLYIYPSSGSGPVRWDDIQMAFIEWKKTNGHHYGNVNMVRERLTEAYGPLPRGGWTGFQMKVPDLEYCDDDREYLRPSRSSL